MDAGIASADNIAWLSEQGYPFGSAQDMLYLAVSRERDVQDPRDQDHAILVRDTGQNTVSVFRINNAETGETRLYCYSDQKAKKEQAIRNRFHAWPEPVEGFVWKRRSTSSMPAWAKRAPLKMSRKYMNASAGCAKKTAVSRQTTV